jgi:hypothetical protein
MAFALVALAIDYTAGFAADPYTRPTLIFWAAIALIAAFLFVWGWRPGGSSWGKPDAEGKGVDSQTESWLDKAYQASTTQLGMKNGEQADEVRPELHQM